MAGIVSDGANGSNQPASAIPDRSGSAVNQPEPPHLRYQRYMLETGQWSTPTGSTPPAGLSQPQPSSIDDFVRQAVAQEAHPATAHPYTQLPSPAATSKPVHPGVVAVIVLVVLAILAATVNAAFKRIIQVTPAEMGIQTRSAVTWTKFRNTAASFTLSSSGSKRPTRATRSAKSNIAPASTRTLQTFASPTRPFRTALRRSSRRAPFRWSETTMCSTVPIRESSKSTASTSLTKIRGAISSPGIAPLSRFYQRRSCREAMAPVVGRSGGGRQRNVNDAFLIVALESLMVGGLEGVDCASLQIGCRPSRRAGCDRRSTATDRPGSAPCSRPRHGCAGPGRRRGSRGG